MNQETPIETLLDHPVKGSIGASEGHGAVAGEENGEERAGAANKKIYGSDNGKRD